VISQEEKRVVPIQVAERIVRQTLDGETISYIVSLPDSEKKIELSKIKGNVYSDLKTVRQTMISNFVSIVDKLIASASETTEKSFVVNDSPDCEEKTAESVSDSIDQEKHLESMHDFDNAEVQFADGSTAKVNFNINAPVDY